MGRKKLPSSSEPFTVAFARLRAVRGARKSTGSEGREPLKFLVFRLRLASRTHRRFQGPQYTLDPAGTLEKSGGKIEKWWMSRLQRLHVCSVSGL
jgi:hypothetical protein